MIMLLKPSPNWKASTWLMSCNVLADGEKDLYFCRHTKGLIVHSDVLWSDRKAGNPRSIMNGQEPHEIIFCEGIAK